MCRRIPLNFFRGVFSIGLVACVVVGLAIRTNADDSSIRFPTVDALRSTHPAPHIKGGYLAGYFAEGDGGQGGFYFDAASNLPDNGGTVFAVNGLPTGRWLRVCNPHVLEARWFGARGDGESDDLTALVAAIVALPDGPSNPTYWGAYTHQNVKDGCLVLSPGVYCLSDTFNLPQGVAIRGPYPGLSGATLRFRPNVAPTSGPEKFVVRIEPTQYRGDSRNYRGDNITFNPVLLNLAIDGAMNQNNGSSSGLEYHAAQGGRLDQLAIVNCGLQGLVTSAEVCWFGEIWIQNITRGPGALLNCNHCAFGLLDVEYVNASNMVDEETGRPYPAVRMTSPDGANTFQTIKFEGNGRIDFEVLYAPGLFVGATYANVSGASAENGIEIYHLDGFTSGVVLGPIHSNGAQFAVFDHSINGPPGGPRRNTHVTFGQGGYHQQIQTSELTIVGERGSLSLADRKKPMHAVEFSLEDGTLLLQRTGDDTKESGVGSVRLGKTGEILALGPSAGWSTQDRTTKRSWTFYGSDNIFRLSNGKEDVFAVDAEGRASGSSFRMLPSPLPLTAPDGTLHFDGSHFYGRIGDAWKTLDR